ncbi:BfmA/BtgA family mobilization protein [Porphyromonas gingivicanis]|uniref:BfmA/BtgA family mobilization protein n=1 Tax=Porphyromonas gingivicanis TaxID=266762 RepID=UPI000470E7BF|nr:BfmA/BtgA family mobilization protein [Porphyromonas gingivicanis]
MAVIKLDDTVKVRLDRLKGKSTYNDYVEKMIAYFEVTKIVPETSLIPPTEEVKKAASRIIEVMRGIEKNRVLS